METNLNALAKEISKHLPGWSYSDRFAKEDGDYGRAWRAELQGPDHQRLFLSTTWAGKGRLYIGGSLSALINTSFIHGIPMPDITVAIDKPPEKIARDIERRLLPDYRAQLAKATEKYNAGQAYEQLTRDTVAELIRVTGGSSSPNFPNQVWTDGVTVRVEGDRITMVHTRSYSLEQFKRLIAALPELITGKD